MKLRFTKLRPWERKSQNDVKEHLGQLPFIEYNDFLHALVAQLDRATDF